MTQSAAIKKTIVNFLGGFGYFFSALQWVLVFVVYQTSIVAFITSTSPTAPAPRPETVTMIDPVVSEPNVLAAIFGAIVVVGIIMLSVYVFIKAPLVVARTSKKAVLSTARTVVPLVLHIQHTPDTPRARNNVIRLVTLAIKCITVIAPLVLVLLSVWWSDGTLDPFIASTAGWWLAGISGLLFLSQYTLAHLFNLKPRDIS